MLRGVVDDMAIPVVAPHRLLLEPHPAWLIVSCSQGQEGGVSGWVSVHVVRLLTWPRFPLVCSLMDLWGEWLAPVQAGGGRVQHKC